MRKIKRFPIITLIGSTKFKDGFDDLNRALTILGNVVLSIGCTKEELGLKDHEPLKKMLMAIHKQKIDMADTVWVMNPGGYMGKHVREEIAYALQHGKEVKYLVKPSEPPPQA